MSPIPCPSTMRTPSDATPGSHCLRETFAQNHTHGMIRHINPVGVEQQRDGFTRIEFRRKPDRPVQEYRPAFGRSDSLNAIGFPDKLVTVDLI